MNVHVVSSGDSLYSLAQKYGVSPDSILSTNKLANPNQLVLGETLLIPTQNQYTVREGDTLYSIAKKFNLSFQALSQANPSLANRPLSPGDVVKLPPKQKQTIITNGFIEPFVSDAVEHFQEAAEGLTYLTVFSYHVDEKGALTPPDDAALLAAIKQTNVQPLMAITNLKESQFDKDVGAKVLNSRSVQDTLIQNVLTVLRSKGYRGVNVDFEYLGSDLREAYNRFIKRLADRLHQEGYIISSSLAPKTSGQQVGAWYESHDYQFHGKVCDFVVLMTYEWGWSGGPPMPVSPITEVEKVLNYALSVMPARRIVMSVPLYGYDWTLPYQKGGEFAKALRERQAVALAAKYNTAISFDPKEASPYFRYTDENGKQHIVYFPDLRMMEAMFALCDRLNLSGISFWNLAFQYPAVWPFIRDYFNVRKR
ncbi:glycoside hydrolase family 18 protein [Pullulanibacillus sp. KACC 23026]|uniref:glycoside hydrolase family 18 protein n=1 Tax=Pullulanibacillus sp. KACC 23026 TaxID=3028315 RepID=UPI0023AFEAC8|nr:glycoside hydrolase family 18 protein [Pullulanibacillus sp. KACC 23026]WEG11328.1 glycoside hydrolase family 18 protein [Pullulanibacillus sp. KACC 23026]